MSGWVDGWMGGWGDGGMGDGEEDVISCGLFECTDTLAIKAIEYLYFCWQYEIKQ